MRIASTATEFAPWPCLGINVEQTNVKVRAIIVINDIMSVALAAIKYDALAAVLIPRLYLRADGLYVDWGCGVAAGTG